MILQRLRTLLLAALLLGTAQLQAQTVYKGLILISHERFTLQGGRLHVFMKVSFDDGAIATGETLLFTPELKLGNLNVRLTTMAVSGDARERYEQRTDELQHRMRVNVPMVARDPHTGIHTFIYDTTIPYQQWMSGSALWIECEENSWQGRNPHVYEDLVISRVPVHGITQQPAAQSVKQQPVKQVAGKQASKPAAGSKVAGVPGRISTQWLQFIQPQDGAGGASVVTGTVQLPYGLRPTKRGTRFLADSIGRIIRRENQRHSGRLFSVEMTGYGAPIKHPRKNERRAAKQTLLLKQALQARHLLGDTDLKLTWVAEDWDSIRRLVAASHMPLKLAAQDIMATVDVSLGREYALRSLGAGGLYQYMRHDIFPRVCRLTYRLYYAPRASKYHDAGRVSGGLLTALTPLNFYDTALAFGFGSQEFYDVIDLAANLFPDCVEACVDAGAVALLHGNTLKARQYLEPWARHQYAWCNLGLLCLMEGNRAQAEVYLRMAASNGVPQARDALRSLQLR
jgi:hypothetical protein